MEANLKLMSVCQIANCSFIVGLCSCDVGPFPFTNLTELLKRCEVDGRACAQKICTIP